MKQEILLERVCPFRRRFSRTHYICRYKVRFINFVGFVLQFKRLLIKFHMIDVKCKYYAFIGNLPGIKSCGMKSV